MTNKEISGVEVEVFSLVTDACRCRSPKYLINISKVQTWGQYYKVFVTTGMAAVDGFIYVVGGCDGQGYVSLSTVEKYDPAINKWSTVCPMPRSLSRCQAAGLKGYLYVAGTVTPFLYLLKLILL